ncbi:MAG: dephospho-CoA kinase, partial [Clostridia bacterium]|nr:dephospho-CoA kinase [Clostridia bacterium]
MFSNSEKKEQLDGIMHSQIVKIIIKTIEDARAKGEINAIFVDAPLLFETGLDKEMDQTWVVDAHDELRIKRVLIRDGSTRKLVKSQIDNQMSREEKNRRATVILDNSTT